MAVELSSGHLEPAPGSLVTRGASGRIVRNHFAAAHHGRMRLSVRLPLTYACAVTTHDLLDLSPSRHLNQPSHARPPHIIYTPKLTQPLDITLSAMTPLDAAINRCDAAINRW